MAAWLRAGIVLIVAGLLAPVWADPPEGYNRLYDSSSDYLRDHADNPVDWYPWGEEAIAAAREQNKPLFVSVGYATCYWCHVAERELYHLPHIAEQMNNSFINIKIDREQRPDLDALLMRATRELTSQVGWPNNVFLTPQLEPFFAGSYFPPEPLPNQPGFGQIMSDIETRWQNEPDAVRAEGQQIAAAVSARGLAQFAPGAVAMQDWQQQAVTEFNNRFEPFLGGFPEPGRSSRFPRTAKLSGLMDLVEQGALTSEQAEALFAMLQYSLTAMASGALFDQVGGGFHRYTVDPEWSMPHFEKMLTDNAQLMGLYARLYQQTEEPYYAWLVARTVDYLEQRLAGHPAGFFSAEDAEVAQMEGKSYVFTQEEIEAVLGDQAEAFLADFELNPIPDNAAGHALPEGGVIRLDSRYEDPAEIEAVLKQHRPQLARLLEQRNQREQPRIDHKQLADWNALVVIGASDAYRHIGEMRYRELALETANWLWETLYDPEQNLLYHEAYPDRHNPEQTLVGEPGFLVDYATTAQAFLRMYEDTGSFMWLSRAQTLTRALLVQFWDEGHGFHVQPKSVREANQVQLGLTMPVPLDGDYIQPSGHTQAIDLLWTMGALTNNQRWQQTAATGLAHIAELIEPEPAQWLGLLGRFADPERTEDLMALVATLEPEEALATGPGRSEDYVSAQAHYLAERGVIIVDVTISEGFHINANPASEAFLVATKVELDVPLQQADYPQGQQYQAEFAPDSIAVYSGSIRIELTPEPDHAIPEQARMRVQACTDEVCLAPGELTFAIEQNGAR